MTNTTPEEFIRLNNFRDSLFSEIKRAMDVYGHWKNYEGEIAIRMPGANSSPFSHFTLVVLCYVASSDEAGTRHEFQGKTLGECIDKAETALAEWTTETDQWIESRKRLLI